MDFKDIKSKYKSGIALVFPNDKYKSYNFDAGIRGVRVDGLRPTEIHLWGNVSKNTLFKIIPQVIAIGLDIKDVISYSGVKFNTIEELLMLLVLTDNELTD